MAGDDADKGRSDPHVDDELDSDTEQRQSMIAPSQGSGVNRPGAQKQAIKMAPTEQGSPTGTFAWVGFGAAVFALAALCVSFCSPYWMQTYPNSFNTFQNMGLWEICMDNYMHHKDDSQQIYNGCWWVFSSAQQYKKLREWLLPPWFISVEVMVVGVLIIQISAVLIVAMVFWHMCPKQSHEYHQTYAMFAASALELLASMIILVCGAVFAELSQDRQWMPRPDQNFLSWGYGFLIISGLATVASGCALYYEANLAYNKLMDWENEYKNKLLENADMSFGYPMGTSQRSSQMSLGQSDRMSKSSEVFQQGGYDPRYGGSEKQYDYGQEKQGYEQQPPYNQQKSKDYGRQPYEQQKSTDYGRQPYEQQKSTDYGRQPYEQQKSYDYGKPSYGQYPNA